MQKSLANVTQLDSFDDIIDARSPAEFAEDHIPGAINLPVLDNEQRAQVGTLYKQTSAFEARRIGGAMVADNIARHLYAYMQDKPKNWRPLVYCWRGGLRSGAFVTWLRMVGWEAAQLANGYKGFRHHVIEQLTFLCSRLRFVVLCGNTGSGKTRILEALAQTSAQVLDLEGLAVHKGSVLGALPGYHQPSQKSFETQIYDQLRGFDPKRPVYIEAESRKIGQLQLPASLLAALHAGHCIVIKATRDARIDFLVRDYDYLGKDTAFLLARLENLSQWHSKETLQRWKALASSGDLTALYTELIDLHYDPLYHRSQNRHYQHLDHAPRLHTDSLTSEGIITLAQQILSLPLPVKI